MATQGANGGGPKSSLYRLADQRMHGTLSVFLARRRGEGLSWEQIARRLEIEHEVAITGETLRAWGKQIGIDDPTQGAA